jgi:hypothetical protein
MTDPELTLSLRVVSSVLVSGLISLSERMKNSFNTHVRL